MLSSTYLFKLMLPLLLVRDKSPMKLLSTSEDSLTIFFQVTLLSCKRNAEYKRRQLCT